MTDLARYAKAVSLLVEDLASRLYDEMLDAIDDAELPELPGELPDEISAASTELLFEIVHASPESDLEEIIDDGISDIVEVWRKLSANEASRSDA